MALALLALSIDCGDAGKLAAFWAAALGRPVDPGATPESAAIAPGDSGVTSPRLLFHQVPEPKSVKNRLHLDLIGNTFEAESQRLAALGATGSATSPRAPPAGRRSPTPKATSSTSSPAEKGLRRGVRTGSAIQVGAGRAYGIGE